jgi:hypothetical protein
MFLTTASTFVLEENCPMYVDLMSAVYSVQCTVHALLYLSHVDLMKNRRPPHLYNTCMREKERERCY